MRMTELEAVALQEARDAIARVLRTLEGRTGRTVELLTLERIEVRELESSLTAYTPINIVIRLSRKPGEGL